MHWPTQTIACPTLLVWPVVKLPESVASLTEFSMHVEKTRKSLPDKTAVWTTTSGLTLKLSGAAEACAFSAYMVAKHWMLYRKDAAKPHLEKIAQLAADARQDFKPVQTSIACIVQAAKAEQLRCDAWDNFNTMAGKTLDAVVADMPLSVTSDFFALAIGKFDKCVVEMAKSGLFVQETHMVIMRRIREMAKITANIHWYYRLSVDKSTTTQIDILRNIRAALFFKERLEREFYFVNAVGAYLMRHPARPRWTDSLCTLVAFSDTQMFNAGKGVAQPMVY